MNAERYFLLIPGVVGIIFIIVGVMLFRIQKINEKWCTADTAGVVVDLVKKRHTMPDEYGAYRSAWYPVVEYEANGIKVRKTASTGSNPSGYQVGEYVHLKYDPQDVEHYVLEEDHTLFVLHIIFSIIGLVLLIITFLLLIFMEKLLR